LLEVSPTDPPLCRLLGDVIELVDHRGRHDELDAGHTLPENLDRILRLVLRRREIEEEVRINGYERGPRDQGKRRGSSSWHAPDAADVRHR